MYMHIVVYADYILRTFASIYVRIVGAALSGRFSVTTPYLCTYAQVCMYLHHTIYIYTPLSAIDYPRLGDIRAPSWATGLERGETIISEFRGTGFAGSAVRGGCRTRRGTVVSREWWFLIFFIFLIEFCYLRG